MAERVGVRELRQNLSRWLRRVEDGESFEVTERGRPIAILAPIGGEIPAVRRLAAQGRLAHVGVGLAKLRLPTEEGCMSISDALEEQRRDRS
jgi:prevent-host-death family protein